MPKEIYNLPTRKEKYLTEQEVRAIVISSMENFQGNFRIKSGTVKTDGGDIEHNSGKLAGWEVTASAITSPSGAIVLDSANQKITVGASNPITIDGANKKIESDNYVSGYAGSGFYIDEDKAEFGNIACRGLIRTSVFQKDVISAMGGNFMVLDSDVLDADMTADDDSDLTTKGTTTFATGDILRIKDGTDDEWLEVTAVNGNTYTVTRDKAGAYGADDNPTWKKGATVVNYGQSGDGGVFMTASESNAPYLSVFTHSGSPWTDLATRLRIGNLNGFLGYTSDKYGIGIGDTSHYLKYDPTNHLQIKGNVDIIGGDAYDKLEANLPSDENLVGYWSFDEGKGDKAYDGSGNGNDGTLTNMADDDWVDGVAGSCLDFDGSNDYVQVTNFSVSSADEMTISAWVKVDDYSSLRTITSFNGRASFFVLTDGKIRVEIQGSGGMRFNTTTALNTGVLYHVVFTKDAQDLSEAATSDMVKIYINGEEETLTTSSTGTNTDDNDTFNIGCYTSGNYHFDGIIDEVRVYNKKLTAAEVYALYKNPAGQPSLAVPIGRLTAGTIYSKQITLAVADGTGDSYIAGGNNLDLANWRGGDASGGAIILGLDDSDSNKAKFFVGNYSLDDYIRFDGNDMEVACDTKNLETFEAGEDVTAGYVACVKNIPDTTSETLDVDAYVTDRYSDTNYGSDGYLWAGMSDGYQYYTFLKIPANISQTLYKIMKVELLLYINLVYGGEDTLTFKSANASWDEGTITWNNKPDVDNDFEDNYTTKSYTLNNDYQGAYYAFDITQIYKQWKGGNKDNYGIRLEWGGANNKYIKFNSSDNANNKPKIRVTYYGAGDGKAYLAKADDYNLCRNVIGVFRSTKSAGNDVKVQKSGLATLYASSGKGLKVWLSDTTAGGVVSGVGNQERNVLIGERTSGDNKIELSIQRTGFLIEKINIPSGGQDVSFSTTKFYAQGDARRALMFANFLDQSGNEVRQLLEVRRGLNNSVKIVLSSDSSVTVTFSTDYVSFSRQYGTETCTVYSLAFYN